MTARSALPADVLDLVTNKQESIRGKFIVLRPGRLRIVSKDAVTGSVPARSKRRVPPRPKR